MIHRCVRWRQQRACRWVVARQHRDELETHTVRAVRHWVRDGVYDAKKRRYKFYFGLIRGLTG